MTFCNHETKVKKLFMFCKKTFNFNNLVWPTLIFPHPKFKNECHHGSVFQMALNTCVARHSCNIFVCWPCLTPLWPWPLLTIRSMLICYLPHIRRLILLLGEKRWYWPFAIWLVTFLRFLFNFPKKYSPRVLDCRPVHLVPVTELRAKRGMRGNIYPPPALSMARSAGDPSAVRVMHNLHYMLR